MAGYVFIKSGPFKTKHLVTSNNKNFSYVDSESGEVFGVCIEAYGSQELSTGHIHTGEDLSIFLEN